MASTATRRKRKLSEKFLLRLICREFRAFPFVPFDYLSACLPVYPFLLVFCVVLLLHHLHSTFYLRISLLHMDFHSVQWLRWAGCLAFVCLSCFDWCVSEAG